MALNPRLIQHGTAGGTSINVDLTRLESSAPVKVHLTASYTLLSGMGVPARPGFTGASFANLDYPRTIPSGATLTLLKGEADALVAASKATYA